MVETQHRRDGSGPANISSTIGRGITVASIAGKFKSGNHHGRPGRMAKHTGGATMNFPATCTAVVTSVQTATVTETATYAPEPTEIDADYEECVTDEEAENMT